MLEQSLDLFARALAVWLVLTFKTTEWLYNLIASWLLKQEKLIQFFPESLAMTAVSSSELESCSSKLVPQAFG